jgi:hypothetical protein
LKEIGKAVEKYQKRREVIRKLIGKRRVPIVKLIDGRIVEVEKGQVIELFAHEQTQKWIRGKVIEVFEDELKNRYYITDYHIRHIQREKHWEKLVQLGIDTESKLLSWIRRIIERPQVIVWDVRESAIYLGVEKGEEIILLSLVGLDTLRVMTVFPKRHIFKNRQRLKLMFSEIEKWK